MYQDVRNGNISSPRLYQRDYTSEIINRCIESTYQKQRTLTSSPIMFCPTFTFCKMLMPTSTPPDLHPAIKVPRMNGWRFIGVDILLNSALNAISHEPVSMYCRIYLGSLFVLLSIIIFFIIINYINFIIFL